MKTSRSLLLVFLVGLLTIFVVSVAVKIYLSVKNPASVESQLSYVLKPSANTIKSGDKVEVPVYLTGAQAVNVTAFDVRINYDSTKLKLVSATPGTFLAKYLTVKWDLKMAWFALALSPSTGITPASPNSPVVTLVFSPVAKSGSTLISTGASTVYISGKGGTEPAPASVSLSLQ